MPFTIIRNNIVNMQTDAVVCPSNSSLMPGGGTCGAIFSAAGYDKLNAACRKLGGCRIGHAVITPGFDLPAKYVIHAVGPIWQDGHHREGHLLRSAYLSSLKLAVKNGCGSIAFPLISAGTYSYPVAEAMSIAREAIRDFLLKDNTDLMVYLVVYDDSAFRISEELVGEVESFIDSHQPGMAGRAREGSRFNDDPGIRLQFEEQQMLSCDMAPTPEEEKTCKLPRYGDIPECASRPVCAPRPSCAPNEGRRPKSHGGTLGFGAPLAQKKSSLFPGAPQKGGTLDDIMANMSDSFSVYLLKLIDRRGLSDPEVYKKANMDRKLFSKIRSNPDYQPSKRTVLALCLSLRLSLDETRDLLSRAGYAFSPADKTDLIIEYFITNRRYDILEVNEVLFTYGLKTL